MSGLFLQLQAIVYQRPSFYNMAVAAVFTREGLLTLWVHWPYIFACRKTLPRRQLQYASVGAACHFLISLGNIGKRKLHACSKNQAATFISRQSWLILFWRQYHDCMPPNISTHCMQKRRAFWTFSQARKNVSTRQQGYPRVCSQWRHCAIKNRWGLLQHEGFERLPIWFTGKECGTIKFTPDYVAFNAKKGDEIWGEQKGLFAHPLYRSI